MSHERPGSAFPRGPGRAPHPHVMIWAGNSFEVEPSIPVILWLVYIWLTLVAGLVTASKGRWGWLVIGFVTAGLAWLYSAFLPAEPGSLWARRRRSRDARR